jgi:exopolysaccharide biosynthesis polyprenyl glycosylphosphotransferase
MISPSSLSPALLNQLTRRLVEAGLHVSICSALRDIDVTRLRVQDLDGQALFYVEPTIRTGWRRVAKRAFDLTIALVGLIVAAPIMLVAAVLIRRDSKGPILFRQSRVGLNGVPFEILKFRTMCVDADDRKQELLDANEMDGPLFKIREDPRITPIGRILRKWSIDELPQFWNVVRGDMSVVGPRPALISEVAEWDPEVRDRLRVLPGITGMWQVSGRSCTSFEEYKRLDLRYVDNWSLAHDVGIVYRTIGAVLRRDGAS